MLEPKDSVSVSSPLLARANGQRGQRSQSLLGMNGSWGSQPKREAKKIRTRKTVLSTGPVMEWDIKKKRKLVVRSSDDRTWLKDWCKME